MRKVIASYLETYVIGCRWGEQREIFFGLKRDHFVHRETLYIFSIDASIHVDMFHYFPFVPAKNARLPPFKQTFQTSWLVWHNCQRLLYTLDLQLDLDLAVRYGPYSVRARTSYSARASTRVRHVCCQPDG